MKSTNRAAGPILVRFLPPCCYWLFFAAFPTNPNIERWLTTYTEANPTRSVYAFCINPKYPGYFHLCFKAGPQAQMGNWAVKVVPQAFELKGSVYPDMRALCNGFKLVFQNQQASKRR